MRIWGCSVAALAVGMLPYAASAQTTGAGTAQQQPPQQEQSSAIGTVPVAPTAAESRSRDVEQSMPVGGSAPAEPSAAAEDLPADDGGDIVVTGQLEGAVQGNPRPELQLDPAAISSYSATSVGELLDQISGQLGTDQPPVILLGGRRSSQSEVSRLPKEAIGRVDILSEEVALRLGYGANQKVVNIVLRRVRLLTEQVDGQAPTEGGVAAGRVTQNLTEIFSNTRRLVVEGTYWETSSLYESERGVSRDSGNVAYDLRGNVVGSGSTEIDPALSTAAGKVVTIAGAPEAAANGAQPLSAFAATAGTANVTNNSLYRTLSGPQRRFEVSASYAHEVSDSVQGSVTAEYSASENQGFQGLPNLNLRLPTGNPYSPFSREVRVLRYYDGIGPQESMRRGQNFSLEGRLRGDGSPWSSAGNANWTLEGSVSRSTSQTWNNRGVDGTALQAQLTAGNRAVNPFGQIDPALLALRPDDTTNSRNTNAQITAQTNGPLFAMPAGNANLSISASGRFQRQTGENVTAGLLTNTRRSQDAGNIRANLSLPITSLTQDVLAAVGNFTLNMNGALERVSYGTLKSTGVGFNWTPITPINLNVNWSSDSNAPNASALGDPITVTPNVRAYDFVRGESVDITRITGGNPNLVAQDQHNFTVRANIRPFTINQGNLNFNLSYSNQRSRNSFSGLPSISAEVEAAFPERFTRDASGRLIALDARQINIARESYRELRFGLNFFKNLPSPSQQRMIEQRQREQAAFRAAMAESQRTGQPLPPEFTARLEEFRRQQQQQSIFGNRGGPGQGQGQGRGFGQGFGQGQGQGQGQQGQGAQAQGQNQGQGQQAQGQGQQGQGQQGQGQGQNRGFGQGGGFGGGGGGGRGFGGGGGGRGGFGGGGGNGIRFNLTYVRVLEDEKLIRAGIPVLDGLNGAAGSRNPLNNSFGEGRWGLYGRGGFGSGGGTSRDNVQATAALNYESYLLQLDGRWVSSSFVNTGTLGSTTRLDYAAFTKIDLTTQINFDRQFNTIRRIPFLRNTQVILNVDNLFNARRSVTDQNGVTPINQDPRLRDPIGRLVRISLRKQFR